MRFLSLFFRYLTLLVLVAGLGTLIGREVLLFWAAEQVAGDVRSLSESGRWNETASRCRSPISASGALNIGTQVRFVNPGSYNLEVKCVYSDPAVKATHSLPRWVQKTTGSAGFFYSKEDNITTGELTLTVLNRSRVVYADGDRVSHTWGSTGIRSQFPESVCSGHGLTCCNDYEHQGDGEAMSVGVTDCPGNCYPKCLQRPVLLSFQTDPVLNHETRRVVTTGSTALVLFSFTYDDTHSAVEQVTIDFGDGDIKTYDAPSQQVSKTYTCAQARCEFVVTVSAVDSRGVQSKPTRLSSLTVEITP